MARSTRPAKKKLSREELEKYRGKKLEKWFDSDPANPNAKAKYYQGVVSGPILR